MRPFPAAIWLFAAILAMPVPVLAGQFYSVVNVDASDTLNVRTGVEAGGRLADTTNHRRPAAGRDGR